MAVDYDILTRREDMGLEACAARLVAARQVAGLSQTELAQTLGIRVSSLNNMENARQYPNREVMRYLFRNHRIDFNFLLYGEHAQLPADVRSALLQRLANEYSATDQEPNSDPHPASSR